MHGGARIVYGLPGLGRVDAPIGQKRQIVNVRGTLIDARSQAGVGRLENILTRHAHNLRVEAHADRALPLQRQGVGHALSRRNGERSAAANHVHSVRNVRRIIVPDGDLMGGGHRRRRCRSQHRVGAIGNRNNDGLKLGGGTGGGDGRDRRAADVVRGKRAAAQGEHVRPAGQRPVDFARVTDGAVFGDTSGGGWHVGTIVLRPVVPRIGERRSFRARLEDDRAVVRRSSGDGLLRGIDRGPRRGRVRDVDVLVDGRVIGLIVRDDVGSAGCSGCLRCR